MIYINFEDIQKNFDEILAESIKEEEVIYIRRNREIVALFQSIENYEKQEKLLNLRKKIIQNQINRLNSKEISKYNFDSPQVRDVNNINSSVELEANKEEKKCDICSNKDNINKNISIEKIKDKNKLIIKDNIYHKDGFINYVVTTINFCPLCGRKL